MKQLQSLIILWALPYLLSQKRAYFSILYYFRSYHCGASRLASERGTFSH